MTTENQSSEIRNLPLSAEDADFLRVILRNAKDMHPSEFVREAAADFLTRLENL